MKKLGFILLILSAVLGCETEEPVAPLPPPVTDTLIIGTIEVADTAELRRLLLGTWVEFEASGGSAPPHAVNATYTQTFRQNGLVDFRDIQTDSLLCQAKYHLKLRYGYYGVDTLLQLCNLTCDLIYMGNIGGQFTYIDDTVFSTSALDSYSRYRRIK